MKKIRFLVIDDANFIRDMIKKQIRDAFPNHETDEALDGKKAQDLIQKREYDLIVSDWEMPKVSGEELLEWLRTESPHPKTPFIMVTSRGDRDHITAAIAKGVSEYIIKPFNNEQLITKITKVLKKHGKVSESDLKKASSTHPTGLGGDSLTALTSHNKAPATPKKNTIATATPEKNKKKPIGRLQLRTESLKIECLITDMSSSVLQCVAKFAPASLPHVGQTIAMDIHQPDNESDIARINGYVSVLSCREKEYPPKFVSLDLTIVDEDEKKRDFIKRFMAQTDR
jgi:DNA-binding response OmpR family regulator